MTALRDQRAVEPVKNLKESKKKTGKKMSKG